jgi:hypothetical protein
MARLKRVLYVVGILLVLTVAVPILADVWVVDHIFVSLANGTIQVYDNAGNPVLFSSGPNVGAQEILTPPAGVHYAGLDFDSTYHPYGTNGQGGGISATSIQILDPHAPLFSFTGSGGVPCFGIVHDGLGNFFVGCNEGGDGLVKNIFEYSLPTSGPPTLSPTHSFAAAFKKGVGVYSLDTADGVNFFFTTTGNCINTFNLTNGTGSPLFCASGSTNLYGLQLVNGGGLLVAADSSVLLISSTGAVLDSFTVSGESTLRSVARDALSTPDVTTTPFKGRFWTGDFSTNHFSEFDLGTCTYVKSVCSTPVQGPFSTGSGTGFNIIGMGAFGGFSAAQPAPEVVSPVTVTPASPTGSFTSSTGNIVTFTVNFTTGTSLTLSPRDTTIVPAAGANDFGNPCTLTAVSGTRCVVWKFDPSTFTGWDSIDEKFESPGQTSNTRGFLDERVDATTGVIANGTTYTKLPSVHSLNEVGGTNEGCFYLSPIDNPPQIASLNNPGNVTFRFQCSALGTNITELDPHLKVLQIQSNGAGTGILVFPPPGQTGGTTSDYRLVDSSTFGVNVDTSGFTGCFLATTFDKNHIASSFYAVFGLNLSTGESCTIP